MLSSKQLTGFLREKNKFPTAGISFREVGIYMGLFNQIPTSTINLLNDIEIDVSVVGRSAFMKNTAVVNVLEKFKSIGVITDLRHKSDNIYQISFKNLE